MAKTLESDKSEKKDYRIGIEVKVFKNTFKSNNFRPMLSDYGKTNTDISKWRPDISIARAQAGSNSNKQFVYDFPDGKDTGEFVMTYIRNKGLDVTEIDQTIITYQQSLKDKVDNAKTESERLEAQKKFMQNLDDIANSMRDSSNTDTESKTE